MPGEDMGNRRGAARELQAPMTVSALAEAGADAGEDPVDLEHDKLALLAELSTANRRIAHYIARVLDIDRGRIEYTRALIEVERELAENLLTTGHSLLIHSRRPYRAAPQHCMPVPVESETGTPERDSS